MAAVAVCGPQAPAWMFTENNTNVERSGARCRATALATASTTRSSPSRGHDRAPDGLRDESPAHYRFDVRRRQRRNSAAPDRQVAGRDVARGPVRQCDETLAPACARPTSSRDGHPGSPVGRRQARDARRLRACSGQAVLSLHRPRLARRRPRQPAASARSARGTKSTGAALQRRRHLDARQVGVPVYDGGIWASPRRDRVDRSRAKSQLTLFLREGYMHPSGQPPP